MKLHLLEPYRSAFISRCVAEQFIEWVPPEAGDHSPALKKCGNPETVADTLQLAVLASEISMVFTDPGEKARRRGLPYMKLAGIQNLDVVRILQGYPEAVVAAKRRTFANIGEFWTRYGHDVDSMAPLLLAQMEARGRGFPTVLFDLLKGVRRGDKAALAGLRDAVPRELASDAEIILQLTPETAHEIEPAIVATSHEIGVAEAWAAQDGTQLAGARPLTTPPSVPAGTGVRQLWGLVVQELIKEEIAFPVPERIADVLKLRNRAEVVDFRSFLIPFLDAVFAGDPQSVQRLQKDLKKCVRALRRAAYVRRIAPWMHYGSVPFLHAEHPAFKALGLALHLPGPLAEKLAHRWEKAGSWFYLGGRP
ncbi:MAG: hypothetical protein JXP73_11805 [Deltaproteobacteria bacterium]|nr:hypothetical protein [Deltaproteobacteria bacterium]